MRPDHESWSAGKVARTVAPLQRSGHIGLMRNGEAVLAGGAVMGFRSCITAVFVSVVLLIGMPCTAMGQPGDAQDNSVALQVFSEGEGSPMVMLGGGTFGAAALAPRAKILATQ